MDSTREESGEMERCNLTDLSSELSTFLSFMFMSSVSIMSLVIDFLDQLDSSYQYSRHMLQGSDQSFLQHNGRKRRRASSVLHVKQIHLLNLMKSYMLFFKTINISWYIRPRAIAWTRLFLDFVPSDEPQRFQAFFRISPTLFEHICSVLHADMVTKPPAGLQNLPNRKLLVDRQVAMALRRLCTRDTVAGIAELFGVSGSTMSKSTWKFIKAVNNRFKDQIKWPEGEALEDVKAGFAAKKFHNCCGAIDGTHFPMELPRGEESIDYYDYKKNVSVSIQAIVDLNLTFLDVSCGWPGSVQDSRLLRNSGFYSDVVYRRSNLHGPTYICRDGSAIREYVLGDAGYPLYDWLIVPYARGIDVRHDRWNYMHSSTRMCVERSFGRLKGVWRILNRILWKPRVHTIGPMLYCCCILHNFLIAHGEVVNPEIDVDPHPPGYGPVLVPTREFFYSGPEAREQLVNEVVQTLDEASS